jgi:hypothetical protein
MPNLLSDYHRNRQNIEFKDTFAEILKLKNLIEAKHLLRNLMYFLKFQNIEIPSLGRHCFTVNSLCMSCDIHITKLTLRIFFRNNDQEFLISLIHNITYRFAFLQQKPINLLRT